MNKKQLEVVEKVKELGRISPAAKACGEKLATVNAWMKDSAYRALIADAQVEYKDEFVGAFLDKVKRDEFRNSAIATAWIFSVKQADPSFNDKMKIDITADKGVADSIEEFRKAVRKG